MDAFANARHFRGNHLRADEAGPSAAKELRAIADAQLSLSSFAIGKHGRNTEVDDEELIASSHL